MNQQFLFHPQQEELTPQARRDEGIAKVLDSNGTWADTAYCAAIQLPKGEYTGEDIRLAITETAGEPSHPNAWGALVNRLVKSEVITATGEYRSMKTAKSHARKTPVYRK